MQSSMSTSAERNFFIQSEVEAQAVKVADAGVIAHARYFPFQISLPRAGDGTAGHPGGKARRTWRSWRLMRSRRRQRLWTLSTKGNFNIIEEGVSRRGWIIGIVAPFILRCDQLELTSQTFFPEYNHSLLTRIKCGA